MTKIFVDTSYFIALYNRKDEFHELALDWARRITAERITCHITIPILFELGDGFSRLNRRETGIDLIQNISRASNYVLHPFRQSTFASALTIYMKHHDKEWGLTDCYSFQIMTEHELTDVLTADPHFKQYGFTVLLKHS
ncbi:MAG: PIN domain-containing protein [candidate division KSB1 bacterium]|nr:PIN domain-containing protein [candidate division KSB1 bacterium]MDZ7304723.1 PIN domain-containing protein [candidate division KSB1 bacterium]MDZ7312779.1 PIN domain-containing protein [candidate division KSB1 bacterium]